MTCYKCGSSKIVKDGNKNGKQNHLCKICGVQFTNDYSVLEYEKKVAFTLYCVGLSLRKVATLLQYSHVTIMNWINSLVEKSNELMQTFLLELSEVFDFLSKRRARVRLAKKFDSTEDALSYVIEKQFKKAFKALSI